MLKKAKLPKARKPSSRREWVILAAFLIVFLLGTAWAVRSWYNLSLLPVSSSLEIKYFTVNPGDTRSQIARNLETAKLIRSAKAFENYVRTHHIDNLQAGTYALSPSMNVTQIVSRISSGDVAKNLLTILPAKRLDEIKKTFVANGYSESEVEAAFNPAKYSDMPIISSLPVGASLEGYLYPDSFQKQANTPAETIVRQSLQELQKYLTADIVSGLNAQDLNVFQGITLASIVEQETSNPGDQPIVAQVFLSRYKQGMMLGSDVTAFYGSEKDGAGQQVFYESPYNTRLHVGLPPGPIGNFTQSALKAVAKPAGTDYLYFVAGDDGVLHFSRTAAEHEAAVAQYCKQACGR